VTLLLFTGLDAAGMSIFDCPPFPDDAHTAGRRLAYLSVLLLLLLCCRFDAAGVSIIDFPDGARTPCLFLEG
jgi:hypothetical protein